MSPSRPIPRALPLALLALFTACTDESPLIDPPVEESRDEIEIQTTTCDVDVRAGTVWCDGGADEPSGALPSIVLNPAKPWVHLAFSNQSHTNEILTFDATVQNLVPQTLGLSKYGTADGNGVRVFFSQLPVVTTGTGTVTVNGAETGKITRVGQLFYRYNQTLAPNQVSTPRQWSFTVPETVITFRYTVLVSASVQYPRGWVEIPHGSILRVDRGASRALKAVVRDALGRNVTASAAPITWNVADPSVATVTGSTLTGAAISGLSSVTATSGTLAASARLEVGAPFTQISAGATHTCGLTSRGRVYCWGWNLTGQLGDNTNTDRHTPTRVATDAKFAQLASGLGHTCALTSAGQAWCWGYNGSGGLGDGTTTWRNNPVPVQQGATAYTRITVGQVFTCALSTAGQAWCWGFNGNGQLGDGTAGHDRHLPVAVPQRGIAYEEITAGREHTCARASRRLAFCWGGNHFGQFGNNTLQSSLTPVRVMQGADRYVQLIARAAFTCARTWNGQAYCWGLNHTGQLGDNTTTSRRMPVPVQQGSHTYVQISAGGFHACGLTAAGQAWCWGRNEQGQLGDHSTTWRTTPVAVQQGGNTYAEITAGDSHTCGRTAAGRVYCWGHNGFGRLGDNTTVSRLAPVPVQRAP